MVKNVDMKPDKKFKLLLLADPQINAMDTQYIT